MSNKREWNNCFIKNNQEILMDLPFFALQEQPGNSRAWYNSSYAMAAKPIKSLGLHYSMITFLIMTDIPWLLSQLKLWNCVIQVLIVYVTRRFDVGELKGQPSEIFLLPRPKCNTPGGGGGHLSEVGRVLITTTATTTSFSHVLLRLY